MKYACKVDFSNNAKETIFAGARTATYFSNFFFHKAVNRNQVISCLPDRLRNQKLGVQITNIPFDKQQESIWIHKHVKDKCVLNVYFKTNDEETIFYEGEEVEIPSEYGGRKLFKLLSFDTLHKAESFVAKENECWLLKTTQPHNVFSTKKEGVRSLLQIYFLETEYEDAVKILGACHDTN